MSAPRRWLDSPDAPDEVRSLFASGHPTRGMSAETRSRMSRRLAKPLAAAVVTSYVLAWKSVAVAAVLALTATTGAVVAVHVFHASSAPVAPSETVGAPVVTSGLTPAQAPAVAPSSAVTVPSPLPSSSIDVPRPTPTTAMAHGMITTAPSAVPETSPLAPATAPSSAPQDTLASELALIDEARKHYASDPQGTLDLLGEHARKFPAGKLAIERELLALDALKELGRTDEERGRAERLLPLVRGTIYEQRVRAHLPG